MRPTQHLYLIPGFFGFSDLGDLPYFAHVREHLARAFEARSGIDMRFTVVRTSPTSSLRHRAQRLLEVIAETAPDDDSPIHLVGHSSGGLDARLMVTPGASLGGNIVVEKYAQRVRSVISVGTPHRGTPVAAFFTSLLGQRILQLLSLGTIYVLRFGHVPLGVLTRLVGAVTRLDDAVLPPTVLDQLYEQLLADFSIERRKDLETFFAGVGADQALLSQITPDGADVFNASTADRPTVRYASVLTKGRAPGLRSTVAAGLNPYAQATHALYSALHGLSARTRNERLEAASAPQNQTMKAHFGTVPDWSASDGVVPTLSQPWGEIIAGVEGDHHDVIGHFDEPSTNPPHYDWLASGSGFTRERFETLWNRVADWVAAST